MGTMLGYECENCSYSFSVNLGVGFLFPSAYRETVAAMKKGEYGQQGKDFFEKFPNGAVNIELVLAQCTKCGEFFSVPDLTLYVSKWDDFYKKSNGNWSVAFPFENVEYVTSSDLEMYYDEAEKYNHVCTKCHANLKLIKELKEEPICPKCGKRMTLSEFGSWD